MEDSIKKEIFMNNYQEYSDNIYRFCLSKVSDKDQVLDIVQETFLKYWAYLQKDKEEIRNHKTFIFTICNNLIIDWYKKRKAYSLEAMTEKETGEDEYIDNSLLTDNDQIEEKSEVNLIIERINLLEEKYRKVVYLRLIEELKPQDIAEILKIPVNNVSVDIHRGIKLLRKNWKYEE